MSKVFVFTQYGGPEHQELRDREVPRPGPGQLLVEVRAAGVNPYDVKFRSGRVGTDRPLPAGLGSEVSGIVAAVGEGVDQFQVGDAVLAAVPPGVGGIAEHALVTAEYAVTKPDELSFAAAATVPVAATTAYDLTHQVELDAGDTVLVIGAGGGVGLMAAQICRVHKFRVIGGASESKRELVESTGAEFVVSGPGFADRVRELAPDGVDLVIDLVGGEVLREAAPLARTPDRVISAADRGVLDLGGAVRKRDPQAMARVADVLAAGLVDPHITATFPLERAADAMAVVESGHAAGKTVVEVA
ncbi:MAG: NADP-dependent oxidoreductase [Brooklawnia sp.]|uniref:quinone oxidoreductase family protein n=1 Tax=Brooklawnia sp. TaxID=2699740 RepID=UPI003C76AAFD